MAEMSRLAELRKLLLGMERALGLQQLSPTERDIYYAATDLAGPRNQVRTTGLMEHVLVTDISRPTFFRALKSLVDKGYLSHCARTSRGFYSVHRPDDD